MGQPLAIPEREHDPSGGSPLRWPDRVLAGVFALAVLFLLWQVESTLTTISYTKATHMTDPGPLELPVGPWVTGYDAQDKPIYHYRVITRVAPAETVSSWTARYEQAVHDDLIAFPPAGH